jgi:hypothetical protein
MIDGPLRIPEEKTAWRPVPRRPPNQPQPAPRSTVAIPDPISYVRNMILAYDAAMRSEGIGITVRRRVANWIVWGDPCGPESE